MVSKIEPSKKRKHADFTRGKSARESRASLTFEQQMDQREKEETMREQGKIKCKREKKEHMEKKMRKEEKQSLANTREVKLI